MARTTIDLVEDILDNVDLSETIMLSYIDGANVFVTHHLGSKGLSEILLTEIERWMAAHMIAMTRERQIKKAGAGGAEVEYTGYWTYGLLSTNYGQMAVNLDTSGTLQELAKQKTQAWTKAVPTAKF